MSGSNFGGVRFYGWPGPGEKTRIEARPKITTYDLRTTNHKRRTTDYELTTTDHELRTNDYGLRTMDYVRTSTYGLRTYGLRPRVPPVPPVLLCSQ